MNNSYLEETSNGIQETAVNFAQAMMYLAHNSEPISLYINSVGGEVNSGVHETMLGGEFGGTAVSIRNLAERINDTQKQLNDILSRHCTQERGR